MSDPESRIPNSDNRPPTTDHRPPTSGSNHIATAGEIRKVIEAQAWTEAERVVLPKSGFALMLRRPTRWYWALRRAAWPVDFRERVDTEVKVIQSAKESGNEFKTGLSREDLTFWVREEDDMAVQAFVQPKASANPDFNSIDPRWLPDEDREFIREYLRGQVSADGTRLDTFSGSEPGGAADGGGAGAEVRQVADGSAAPGPVGVER